MLQFFNHIRGDEVDEALGILDAGTNILRLVDVNEKGEMMDGGNDVLNSVIARAENLINVAHRSSSSQDALTELTSVMVLAAQHRGLLSRTWWVEKVGAQVGFRDDTVPSMVGLPVLITATDTANGVTNGDTGLIITSDGQTLYQPATVVTTSESDDVSASRLPPTAIHSWQPWWAMTIHKSQGSEFDEVIVSITPQTRLLSKELLYTAVTRAKKRVTIVGRRADVEKALKTPAHRYSGLAEIINSLMSA
jgi:exodeoxyribonuclease V alpha subunit